MTSKGRYRLLAILLSVCLLTVSLAGYIATEALSTAGEEYLYDATWSLEANGAAANTGTAIEGLAAGAIVRVPNVDFLAGEYRALAVKTAGESRVLCRLEVYADRIAAEDLLASLDFWAGGESGKEAYSDWAAFSKTWSGTHDLLLRVAAGQFTLHGFRLGSLDQLDPDPEPEPEEEPEPDGVLEEAYARRGGVLIMEAMGPYDTYRGSQHDTTFAIRHYATKNYLYLAMTLDTAENLSVGNPFYTEIAIVPDPSKDRGDQANILGTRLDGKYGDLLCYYDFGKDAKYADNVSKGNLIAQKTATENGRTTYTVEFRIQRPENEPSFWLGCSVTNGGQLFNLGRPKDESGPDPKTLATMTAFDYEPEPEPEPDGVLEEAYARRGGVLKMEAHGPYAAYGGDHDITFTIRHYATKHYLYLAMTLDAAADASHSNPFYTEIAIVPDPSTDRGDQANILGTRLDGKYGDLLCYYDFGKDVKYADNVSKGNLIAQKTATENGRTTYTVEFRIRRPENEPSFWLGCSVTDGGGLFNLGIPKDAQGPDPKTLATMTAFDYEPEPEPDWEPKADGKRDALYDQGIRLDMPVGSPYHRGDNPKDLYASVSMAATEKYLYYYLLVNGLTDVAPRDDRLYAELNFDPDPSNSPGTGNNQDYVTNGACGDFRYYFQLGNAADDFGWQLTKGVRTAKRITALENNRTEYALELCIPRPEGETEFRFGLELVEGSSVLCTSPQGSNVLSSMLKYSYEEASVKQPPETYFAREFPVSGGWQLPPSEAGAAGITGLHTGSVVKIERVNFGEKGARFVEIKAAGGPLPGSVELYAGGLDEAHKIGRADIPAGSRSAYGGKYVLTNAVYGEQTLYLKPAGGVWDVSGLKFSGDFPVYAELDGEKDDLYTENHLIDMTPGGEYQVGANAIDIHTKLYYYVTEDYFYLYTVSDVPEDLEELGNTRFEMFIDPDPSKNLKSGTMITAIQNGGQGEQWFAWNFGTSNTWGMFSVPYKTKTETAGGRTYYAAELRLPRPSGERYFHLGFRVDSGSTMIYNLKKEVCDSSHYGNAMKIYYRDPIVVDGIKDDTYGEETLTRLTPGSEYEVGSNAGKASTDLYYEFDDQRVYLFAETKTEAAPSPNAVMRLFADTDPFRNDGRYAGMSEALEDPAQSESGFTLTLNGSQAAGGRAGTLEKDTQVAYKADGPDANGVYTYRLEASMPRILGETYFLFGYELNVDGKPVLSLAKTASPADSYDTAKQVFYLNATPMSWLNLLGKSPVWDAKRTNKTVRVTGSVLWSFPYTEPSVEKPGEPTSPVTPSKPAETSPSGGTNPSSKPDVKPSSKPSVTPDAPGGDPNPGEEDALKLLVEQAIAQSADQDGIVLTLSEDNCVLTEELLQLLQSAGKPVTIAVYASGGSTPLISWRFQTLANTAMRFDPRLLPSDNSGIPSGRTGLVISLAHKGALPGPASVTIPHGGLFAAGDKLMIYVYSEEEGRMVLSEIPASVADGGQMVLQLENGGIFAAIKAEDAGSPAPSPEPETPEKEPPKKAGWPWWATALIIAGGVLLLGGGGFALFAVSKRRKEEKGADNHA